MLKTQPICEDKSIIPVAFRRMKPLSEAKANV